MLHQHSRFLTFVALAREAYSNPELESTPPNVDRSGKLVNVFKKALECAFMTSISDLAIAMTPFHLTIKVTDKTKVPSIRDTEIVLAQIEIPDHAPHDEVNFRNILEYVCWEIGRQGLQLSFYIEKDPKNDRELDANRKPKLPNLHLKTTELTKRYRQRLADGRTPLSHTAGSEVWHWTEHRSGSRFASVDKISCHASAFHKLESIEVPEPRNLVFNFGVAQAS